MSYRIENQARDLATMLDRGQGEQVAQILRSEMYQLNPREFSRLVRETNQREQNGRGDDLRVRSHGGYDDVSIEINGRDAYGRRVRYEENIQAHNNWNARRSDYAEPYRRPCQEWKPFQTRHEGLRPEDIIVPTLGLGLGLLGNALRSDRRHFYPDNYRHAPNYYQHPHHVRFFGF
jgi:hypothetical protein